MNPHIDCGRVRLGAEIVPLEFTFKITFIPQSAITIWTDPPMKTVVWKRAKSIGEAVGKCFLDGDVQWGWQSEELGEDAMTHDTGWNTAHRLARQVGTQTALLRHCRTAIQELSWTAGDRLTPRQKGDRDALLERIEEALQDDLTPIIGPEGVINGN